MKKLLLSMALLLCVGSMLGQTASKLIAKWKAMPGVQYENTEMTGDSIGMVSDGEMAANGLSEEEIAFIRKNFKGTEQVTMEADSVLMETLAIIAYKQPVTKLEIEKIRGVKSDHAVNKLVEYELVAETGRMDAPGRPILFGTTENFLRHFGIDSVENLPRIDPVRKEDFRLEASQEIDENLKV